MLKCLFTVYLRNANASSSDFFYSFNNYFDISLLVLLIFFSREKPHKKGEDYEISRSRSFTHLNAIIDHNVSVSPKMREEFDFYLADEMFTEIDPQKPTMITLGLIERVNTAIKDIFEE